MILAGGLVFFVILLAMGALYVVTAEQKSQAFLEKWEAQLGIKIRIREKSLSFGGISFEGITFDPNYRTTISSIRASIDINPLSPRFGKLAAIHIGHLRSTIQESALRAMIAEPRQNSSTANFVDPDLTLLAGILSPEKLPTDFVFEHGQITIVQDDGEPLLELKGLKAQYVRDRGVLHFKARQINYQNSSLAESIAGQFIMENDGRLLPFLISGRSGVAAKKWEAKGQLAKNLSSIKIFTKNQGLPPSLSSKLERLIPNADQLTYAVNLQLVRARNDFQITAHLGTANLAIKHPVIAGEQLLGPIPLRIKLSGLYESQSDTLNIKDGTLVLYPAKRGAAKKDSVSMAFQISKQGLRQWSEQPLNLTITMQDAPCQSLISHVPANFIPRLQSFQLNGTYAFAMDMSIPPHSPEDFQFSLKNGRFDCHVVGSDREFSPGRLLAQIPVEPRTRAWEDHQGASSAIQQVNYVTTDQISRDLLRALVISEDAGFWRHNGFEFSSMLHALRRNLTDRRVSVGGSTITMQTVKNLFLNQKRTLSRKAQEIFLTWYLEQKIPKQKILEIYANIIEFGPGIWGIKQAARHFFNKTPAELDLMESVYLASVLPSPGRRYQNFCQGYLSRNYQAMVINSMQKMLAFNMISVEQFQNAKNRGLLFDTGQRDPQRCAIPVALGEKKSQPSL